MSKKQKAAMIFMAAFCCFLPRYSVYLQLSFGAEGLDKLGLGIGVIIL